MLLIFISESDMHCPPNIANDFVITVAVYVIYFKSCCILLDIFIASVW